MSGFDLQPLGPRPLFSTQSLNKFRQRMQLASSLFPEPAQIDPVSNVKTADNDPDVLAWVEETTAAMQSNFMAVMRQKVQEDPDLAAEVKKMSIDLGMDREVIRNNVDKAREAMALVRMRDKEFMRNSPLLTAFATNPDFAAMAHDDLKGLADIETWSKQWDAGRLEVERGELGRDLAMLEPGTLDYDLTLNRMELVERYLAAIPQSNSMWIAPARMFGQMYETSPASFAAGTLATAAVGLATGGIGTAAVVSGTLAGAAVGGYQSAIIEGGNAFRDFTLAGMDREIAKSEAVTVGIINGFIEVAGGLVPAGQFASAGRNMVRRMVGRGLAKGTRRRSIAKAVGGFAMSFGSELAEESGQEATNAIRQSIGMDATEELREQIGKKPGVFSLPGGGTITTLDDGSIEVSPDVYERYTGKLVAGDQKLSAEQAGRFVSDMGRLFPLERTLSEDSFYEDLGGVIASTIGHTALAAWLPALPGSVIQFATDRKRIAAAKRAVESIRELSEKADGTKLSKRDATFLSDFIESTLKGKSLETLFIDRQDLQEVLTKAGVSIKELDAILPGVEAQMALDPEVAPSIEIKPSELATKLSSYEILPELLEVVRPNDPVMPSLKQQREKQAEFKKKAKEHREKLKKEGITRDLEEAYLDSVEEEYVAQLVEAEETLSGKKVSAEKLAQMKATAAIFRNIIYTEAVRQGVDVSQIPKPVRFRAGTAEEERRAQGDQARVRQLAVDIEETDGVLAAKTEGGRVQGQVSGDTLQITFAEVDEPGQGVGVELYSRLIDEAHSRGLRVVSDVTVEASAVRVYEALTRRGYVVEDRRAGTLEEGAAYGEGVEEAAFEVKPRPEGARLRKAEQPTRLPGGVDSLEDAQTEMTVVNFVTAMLDKKSLAKNAQLIRNMQFMRIEEGLTDEEVVEAYVEHVARNLDWLYGQMSEEERERSQQWYVGGRKFVDTWADRYGLHPAQAAAVIAVLSPQKDWFVNMTMAERMLDIYFNAATEVIDEQMVERALVPSKTPPEAAIGERDVTLPKGYKLKDVAKEEADKQGVKVPSAKEVKPAINAKKKALREAKSKRVKESEAKINQKANDDIAALPKGSKEQAAKIRAKRDSDIKKMKKREAAKLEKQLAPLNEKILVPALTVLSKDSIAAVRAERDRRVAELPSLMSGKTLLELPVELQPYWVRLYDQTHNEGTLRRITPEGGVAGDADQTIQWAGYAVMAKVLSVLRDSSKENIGLQIGDAHKVRSFYNNLVAPYSKRGHLTIDTHAVGAGYLLGLASGDKEVKQAWGGEGATSSKATGLKGLYPYLWEAYRRAAEKHGLLPREMQSITWEQVRALFGAEDKRGDLPKQLKAVWKRYKDGEIEIEQVWEEVTELGGGFDPMFWDGIPADQPTGRTYNGRSVDESKADVGRPQTDPTIGVEAKPNLNPELLAEWESLTDEQRATATNDILEMVAQRVARQFGTNIMVVNQRGGWMGEGEASIGLIVDDPSQVIAIADALGEGLYQEGMFIVSPAAAEGLELKSAVSITLPAGMSAQEIDKLYKETIWPTEINGERVAKGHTAKNGYMLIAGLDQGVARQLADTLADRIDGVEIQVVESYSAQRNHAQVAKKGEAHYGTSDTRRDATARRSPAEAGVSGDDLLDQGTARGPFDDIYERAFADARGRDGDARLRQLGDGEQVDGDDTRAARGDQADEGAVQDGRRVPGSGELLDEQAGAQSDAASAPLEGLPTTVEVDGVDRQFGPSQAARDVAAEYYRDAFGRELPVVPLFVPVDRERATRIAAAYEEMKHDPNNPEVRAAYEALARETIAQYEAILSTGVQFEFMPVGEDGVTQDPYGNPRNAILDLSENNHMYVFSTEDGFGDVPITDADRAENPMLAETKYVWNGKPVLVNDLFRAVHDYFGHFKEGLGTRARGEENAWQQHMTMFSPEAQRAMTSETRGQNSWVNFGPEGEANLTASGEDTVYAEQKIGLLPDWVMTEGYSPVSQEEAQQQRQERQQLRAAGEGTVFGEFDPAKMEIILFRRHNMATWLHEFAHFHFEAMTKAYREGRATKQQIADLTAIAMWAGYKSLDDYARPFADPTADLANRRAAHEAFAYSFEEYLYKDKAPNLSMRGVFRRVASWMAGIYGGPNGIKNRINASYREETRTPDNKQGKNLPGLTPEVVAVMDRLVASEEEIDMFMRQGAIGRVLELLASPLVQGVSTASLRVSGAISEEDLERLGDLFDDAKGKAKEVLRVRLMKDLEYLRRFESRKLREIQSRSKKVRKAVEEDEREQLLVRERVARLQHWLKTGEVLGVDDTNEEGPVLVRDEETKKSRRYLVTDDDRVPPSDRRKSDFGEGSDRVSPEMAAEMFGYDSVDQMLDELSIAQPLEQEVQSLADARMKAEYSELNTPEAMKEAVREAVNSEAMLRFYESHARAELQKERDLKGGPRSALELRRAAKAVAMQVIAGQNVKDLEKLGRKYSQEADRTYERGLQSLDPEKKQSLLRASIQQRALAVEAFETKAAIEKDKSKLRDLLRDTGKSRNKSLAKTYGGATVATIREMLRMLGIDMGNKLRQDEGGMPWDDLVVANEDEIADDPLVTDLQLAYVDARDVAKEVEGNFDNLTVEQAESMLSGMRGLLKRGRESQTFILDNQRIALDDLIIKLEKMAEERGIPEPSIEPRERSGIATTNSRWQRLEALLLALDGGKAGVLTQNIWQPAMKAAVELELAEVEILQLFDKALEPLRKQMRENPKAADPIVSSLITDNKTGKNFVFRNGKQSIIGMLLHLGNPGNRQRLVSGYRWSDDALTEQIKQWEQDGTITEEDWKIVSDIWAIYDKMLPQTKKAFYAIEGYSMEIVETWKVDTAWGEIKGGYVPAAADTSVITNVQASQQELDQKGSWSFSLPTVQNSMVQGRAKVASRPLDLDLMRQQRHFHAHLLYSHMGPALRRIQQFVGNKDVQMQLERIQPGIYNEFLNGWLETVGTQTTSLSKNKDVIGLDYFASHARRSAGMAAMFANVKNSIQGISGLALAIARVNPGSLLLAVGDLVTAPLAAKKEIYGKSKYMLLRHREGNSVYEVRDKVEDLLLSQNMIVRGGQKLSKWMAKNTYWMQEIIQKPIDRIVWLGAYKQELDAGGSEEDAILAGDAAVRQTQGDTMAISLAEGEKGTATMKMFTQFMSWFIMMGSLRADFTVAQPKGKSRVAAAAPVLMTMLVTMVIGEIVTETLDRLASEPEDEEERVRRGLGQTSIRILLNSVTAPLRMFGLAGAGASSIAAMLFNMEAYQQRMPSPPALSVITRLMREGKQMVAGEDPFSTEDVLDFSEALLILLGAGGVVAGTKRVRRGFGIGVDLEPREEPFDISGLTTGYR